MGDGYDYDTVESQAEGAIALRDTRFEGNIVNNGEISNQDEFGKLGDKAAIVAERTQVIGNIINNGQMQGGIELSGIKRDWTDNGDHSIYTSTAGHGSITGDIVNRGEINSSNSAISIDGADVNGDIVNQGVISSEYASIRISGGHTAHEKKYMTMKLVT